MKRMIGGLVMAAMVAVTRVPKADAKWAEAPPGTRIIPDGG
jgi:hypothetical protein